MSCEDAENVKRREVAARLKEAISFGDLSENSEYEDAKNEQALVENRISELKGMIKTAKIITEKKSSGKIVKSRLDSHNSKSHRQRRAGNLHHRRLQPRPIRPQKRFRTSRRSDLRSWTANRAEEVSFCRAGGGAEVSDRESELISARRECNRERIRRVVRSRNFVECENFLHHFLNLFFIRPPAPRRRHFDLKWGELENG